MFRLKGLLRPLATIDGSPAFAVPEDAGGRDMAPWFARLWAENPGKIDATGAPVGPTPVAAGHAQPLCAVDSALLRRQIYMLGPDAAIRAPRDHARWHLQRGSTSMNDPCQPSPN